MREGAGESGICYDLIKLAAHYARVVIFMF